MRVLVACEESGTVRDAFIARGHDAWSCDLAPSRAPGPHIVGDVLGVIGQGWDLMICHPPCTFLNSAGLHWIARGRIEEDGRPRSVHCDEALEFARKLLDAPIAKICLENPIGCISTRIRKYDQLIQPYQFGDDASKATCLWLKGLSKLTPTKRILGRVVVCNGKTVERWANQTDSGQNRLGPSPTRKRDRSVTYPGIARAMAEQWGSILGGGL